VKFPSPVKGDAAVVKFCVWHSAQPIPPLAGMSKSIAPLIVDEVEGPGTGAAFSRMNATPKLTISDDMLLAVPVRSPVAGSRM